MDRPYYSKIFLKFLRNNIPINQLIISELNIPVKPSQDDYLRFCCPICQGFHTATDARTNLARCFDCQKNFNPIDLVLLIRDCSFIAAVRFLIPLLPTKYKSFFNL